MVGRVGFTACSISYIKKVCVFILIEEDNPEASIQYLPAMIRVESTTGLIIRAETVSEKLGQDWDIQELQLNMITLGGNVDEDDDTFTLKWN